jgi:hypothetical protein
MDRHPILAADNLIGRRRFERAQLQAVPQSQQNLATLALGECDPGISNPPLGSSTACTARSIEFIG